MEELIGILYLNTSNVNVNLPFMLSINPASSNLNTSNVNVNHPAGTVKIRPSAFKYI